MDILIPNSWLKKFLDTKASPSEIAKYLSLCGPSIEKVEKTSDNDNIFSVEVTTNRIDSASVMGIAREAGAILPRFGIKAKMKMLNAKNINAKFVKKVKYLDVKVDEKLCPRFSAVLIKNVTVKDSPKEIKALLEKVGVRPINNIVDVSNFIMHELGQPVHTFDYDKILNHKMVLRESKKDEKLTTLDGKTFKLSGGDIVIEDLPAQAGGKARLIDLCGIMGGQNSAIDENTKNVLLFVQTYDKHHIRKTSMTLAQRSEAAVLFEKGLDAELVKPAILSAIEMIVKLSGGKAENEIIDIYKKPYKQKFIQSTLSDQEKIIGIKLNKKDINSYLESLGFEVIWNNDILKVGIPSHRADDMDIPEDIAEEIARIYGYHNLPNVLMNGDLPKPRYIPILDLERKIKHIIESLGGIEILNLSLTNKNKAGQNALRLKNAMGEDTEYLRTSLMPGLIENLTTNSWNKNYFHLFELSNIYKPAKNDLPKEISTLAGIIKNGEFRENKGLIETLLQTLNIDYSEMLSDGNNYLPNQKIEIISAKTKIGEYGNLESGHFYYEFEIEKLLSANKVETKFKEPPKFPPQIEDITFDFPERTFIGEVIKTVKSVNQLISKSELKDVYKNSYTINVEYQDKNKTLTDKEVGEIRNKIIKTVKDKFAGSVKG